MQECYYIHPDNVQASREELGLRVAVIARPHWFMEAQSCRQLIVETERGVHLRCYLASHEGIPFLIVYGRFDRRRGTSHDINYELTQEVFSFLGITHAVGTFVVGSLRKDDQAGCVYIPDDFVGLGGYNSSRSRSSPSGFRNVDMLVPFCNETRQALIGSAEKLGVNFQPRGTYVCFHGWPRLETAAELAAHDRVGGDVVGQTLDPEATLAREGGTCYAALAVTIDDYPSRMRYLADPLNAGSEIRDHLRTGRKRTFEIFLSALPQLVGLPTCDGQAKLKQGTNWDFYYRPPYLMSSRPKDY